MIDVEHDEQEGRPWRPGPPTAFALGFALAVCVAAVIGAHAWEWTRAELAYRDAQALSILVRCGIERGTQP